LKDRQSLVVFLVILGMLVIFGVFCYTHLEIVPSTRWKDPSREVQANQYFALDKWLEESGRPVRAFSTGNIATILNAPERTVFIANSRFTWTGSTKQLAAWVKAGGQLVVSLDTFYYIEDIAEEFMDSFGVGTTDEDEDDASDQPESAGAEDGTAENSAPDKANRAKGPSFDKNAAFTITERKPTVDRIKVMRKSGRIKLVKCETGKGWVVFTGEAGFLHNYSLYQEENANLAWELFLAAAPERAAAREPATVREPEPGAPDGVLFIRALSGERHFFGNLAERGNPTALAVSLALLIIVGFWMVIPPFGRYEPAPEKPGKPLRERFLAEGRFLKKYNALGKYIEVYTRELEQARRSGGIRAAAPELQGAVPAAAVMPGAPVAPNAPVTPAAPDTPAAPNAPAVPGTTAAPDAPVTPVAPDTPVTPGAPAAPEITVKQFMKEQKTLTEMLDALSASRRGNL